MSSAIPADYVFQPANMRLYPGNQMEALSDLADLL
jgi:hypothetical protein